MLRDILEDSLRYYPSAVGIKFFARFFLLIINPGFLSVICYRVANTLSKIKLSFFSSLIMLVVKILFDIEIGYRAQIGPGVLIPHTSGIVIGGGAIIGKNVFIGQGVTLGSNFRKSREIDNLTMNQPIVKDDCFIMAGAKIVGPVIVEKKCIIGANSVITSDTEEGWVYGGIPAKKIKKSSDVR